MPHLIGSQAIKSEAWNGSPEAWNGSPEAWNGSPEAWNRSPEAWNESCSDSQWDCTKHHIS